MREEVAADLTLSLPEEPFESDREAELLFDNEYDRIRVQEGYRGSRAGNIGALVVWSFGIFLSKRPCSVFFSEQITVIICKFCNHNRVVLP